MKNVFNYMHSSFNDKCKIKVLTYTTYVRAVSSVEHVSIKCTFSALRGNRATRAERIDVAKPDTHNVGKQHVARNVLDGLDIIIF